MIHLDFETYSEANIKKVGAYRYAADPSTEILCMGWEDTDFGLTGLWKPGDDLPYWMNQPMEFHGWNVFFETVIWEFVGRRLYQFPQVPITQWGDTMALAAYFGLPLDLARASMVVDPKQAKDPRGRYLISVLCQPVKKTKARPWTRLTPENSPELFEELYDYCEKDVQAEKAVHNFLPRQELPETEYKIWLQNLEASMRGVHLDLPLIKKMTKLRDEHVDKLVTRFTQVTGGITPTQVAQFQEFLATEHGVILDNLRAETLRDLMAEDNVPAETRELIEIRQSISKTSVKKLDSMLACAVDSRAHGMNVYYGTHTGRNAGRLIQLLNLPRGDFQAHEILHELVRNGLDLEVLELLMGEPMTALSTLIRGCLRSTPGKYLYLADYNAIEAIVLAWMAGQEDLLAEFRQKIDPYISAAAEIYQVPREEVTKDMRALGKVQILGCGFQMGEDRFAETCADWGVTVERELSDLAVQLYRQKNDKIVSYWWMVDNSVKAAIQAPNTLVQCGPVKVASTGRWLYAKLPSGRTITYPMPAVESKRKNFPVKKREVLIIDGEEVVREWQEDNWRWVDVITYMGLHPKTKQWCRLETYGGKLTENWTQGIARDVMAEAALRTEEAGFDYLFSVYDEIVSECDDPMRLDEYLKLMIQVPKWARGMPVAAEGAVTLRFKK